MKRCISQTITILLRILLLLSLTLSIPAPAFAQTATESPDTSSKIYLPSISNGGSFTQQSQPPPQLAYVVGNRYIYQWDLMVETRAKSQDTEGAKDDSNVSWVKGIVQLQILSQATDGTYHIALSVYNPLIIASAQDEAATSVADPTITAALATPLLFQQTPTGAIREIQYNPEAPTSVLELQKGIVNFLQLSLQEGPTYTVEEEGGQGRYRSHYTLIDNADQITITKTVDDSDFIEMVRSGSTDIAIRLQNQVKIDFDQIQGILQSVDVTETISTDEPTELAAEEQETAGAVSFEVLTQGRLQFLQVQPATDNSITAASANYISGRLRANLLDAIDEPAEIDFDTNNLAQELQLFEQDQSNVTQMVRLAELARQNPSSQVVEAAALRMAQVTDEQLRMMYTDLLVMAATVDAQQVIVQQILSNEQAGAVLQLHTLTQLADLKQPTPELIAHVTTLSQSNNAELQAQALLTLGGLANSLQQVDTQAATQITNNLVDQLQMTTSDEVRELLLLAVGNAGVATTEGVITSYLSHVDPHVRGAAILALRKIPGEPASAQLVERLSQESNGYVQEMAAIALAHRLEKPQLYTVQAEQALAKYATVTAAAVDGTWAKSWAKSFSAGPLTVNLPGDITIKGAPDAPALTFDANQAGTGRIMGINFSLFRAKLLSDAPSGARRFGAYFWLGSNTLIGKYEAQIPCTYAKSGVLWEGTKEFFSVNTSIPVYGILIVTLNASASGYAKITYDYQQQLCNLANATFTGSITPQTAITAQGSAYASLQLLRGGVVLTADILKSSLPAQAKASLMPNSSPRLQLCIDVRANIEPLSGQLTARAERRKYLLFGGWKSLGSWDIWKFSLGNQSFTLLRECVPPAPERVCYPEFPNLPAVFGTEFNDTNLRGTANAERICGLGGNDTIYGAKGNDAINGNQGDDNLNGELGDDIVRGGQGNDSVNGGEGNDKLYGDLGNDILNGNQGNDTVAGGEGNDIVRGGQDNDTVLGEAGNDTLYGDNGNDRLSGGAGSDIFVYYVGNGNDEITDFQWSADRLQLYGTSIRSKTQQGKTCQLNLASGTTIRLLNVGTCRNPATAAAAIIVPPKLTAKYEVETANITVQESGFAAHEKMDLLLNDTYLLSATTDDSGLFVAAITWHTPLVAESIVFVPAYQSTNDSESIASYPVEAIVNQSKLSLC